MLICRPIWFSKKKIDFAIAGEVVKGPYQIAQNHVAEQNLQEKIEVRLANGLAAFEESDAITSIVIAGMGGILIFRNSRSRKR